ncbi:hypothetical protein M9Y10_028484 [Tritrichomonas musculus]|uniref:Calponin-homology (CH) domain-containing protein n=1 Tax=Tritrichomonas musculus TaxID=1915356 RepID=A0ABR2KKJ1_9EUKA
MMKFEFHPSNPQNKMTPYSIPDKIEHSKLVLRSSLFYGLTNYLIQNPRNITMSAITLQLPKYKTRIENPRKDQYAKYSLLFNNIDIRPSMIAKAWSIAYAFPYDLIDVIFYYLHPLEAETVQAIMQFYQLVNKNNIDQLVKFSKWMLSFGNEQSILWRVKNSTFDVDPRMNVNDAKRLIQQIDREIKELSEALELNKNIWSKEIYINDLESAKIPVKEIIQSLIRGNEELKLRHMMGNLIEKLQKAKISKKQHDQLRQLIITQISKALEQPLDEQKVKDYENKVNKFLDCINKEETNITQNNIMWPFYTPSRPLGNVPSKSMKLYQHIIWFSQVNSICLKIIDRDNENVFDSVTELGEYIELQSLVHMLVSRITNTGSSIGSTFLPDDIEIMFSTINAIFLSKLYKDNLINDLYNLDKFLNSLGNREHIKEERDIEWIHKIASQYPPDFDLVLPKFNPKDLFFLFVGYKGQYEAPNPGPIIGNLKCANVIESIKLKISSEVDNFISCSDIIGKQIYRIIIDQRGQIPSNHQDLKQLLKDSCPKSGDSAKVVKITLEVMKIAENMSKMTEYKFTFHDRAFLSQNWIKDNDFINNYPSFLYWLCKNQRCTHQLQSIYDNFKFDSGRLPFWLFAVRLMSSEDCIKFDFKAETDLGKLICTTVESSVTDSLHRRLENHESIGSKWISFVLSSVSPDISIPNYRLFYQYLASLCEDDKKCPQFIDEKKTQAVKTFVNNVCSMIFDDTVDRFLNITFSTSNSDLSFTKDPNRFINSIVQSNISNIYSDFIASKEFTQLQSFSQQKQSHIMTLISDFSNLCDQVEELKKDKYEKSKAQKRNAEIDRMEKDITKIVTDYNNEIDIINSPQKFYFSEYSRKCYKLKKLREKLPDDIEDFNKPAVFFNEFTCQNPRSNTYLIVKNVESGKSLKIGPLNETPIHFVYPKYDDDSIKNAYFIRDNKRVTMDKFKFQFYEMHPISNSFNITQYCLENFTDTTNYDVPVLNFGSNLNKTQFIGNLQCMSVQVHEYIRNMQLDFQNRTVNEKTFKNSRDFWYDLRTFNSTLPFVKFSDNDSCHQLTQPLRDILAVFQQYQNLIAAVNSYLMKNVENSWQMFNNQSQRSYSIFNYEYKLPIPEDQHSSYISEDYFRNIVNSDFLSSPILNVDNNQITCCFDTLDCKIGPIIPALYSKSIAMNFISFIEEPISISIETDQQYSNWFNPGCYSDHNDIVQIFVNIPAVTSDKIEEYKVPTRLHFKSQSFKELILPCDFSFTLLPLSILINCSQFPLSYKESENSFILCTNKLLSGSKLSFSLKNFNLKDKAIFSIQLASLKDNECTKPDYTYNYKDDCIYLTIPTTENAKRLNFALKIAFSDHFKTSIVIDAAIIPFDFECDVYDVQQKTYSNRTTIQYSRDRLDRPISLHFRLYSPSFIGGFSGEITDQLPSAVVIQKYESITKKFNVKCNTNFDIVLKMNQVVPNYDEYSNNGYGGYSNNGYGGYSNNGYGGYNNNGYGGYSNNGYYSRYSYNSQYGSHSSIPTYYICVKINGIEKKIQIKFNEIKNDIALTTSDYFNTQYVNRYPVYGYNRSHKDWNKICNPSEHPSHYQCIVSPFNSISSDAATVSYDPNYQKDCPCKVTAMNQNKFIYVSNFGTYDSQTISQPIIIVHSRYFHLAESIRLIPIIGIFKNNWYPTFKDYPKDPFNWNELDVQDSNVEIARDRIKKLPDVTINVRSSNFLVFAELLEKPKVVKDMHFWIKGFPIEFQDELSSTMNIISNMKEKDDQMKIMSHNLIRYFCKKLSQRYEEIENNNFNIIPVVLTKTDIMNKMDQAYKEYTEIDSHAASFATITSSYVNFRKIEDDINRIQIPPKPTEHSEAYLFSENSKPIPKKRTDKPQLVSQTNFNKSSTSSMNKVEIKLPNINIPSQSEQDTLTLSSLNNIYLQCLQGTRLLPIFVFNIRQQKSTKMEEEANKYFLKLLNIYKGLPVKDHSFVSNAVNLFSSSFAIMIGKFKKAGADLKRVLPAKCNITEVAIQDFIQYPEKDKPFLPQENWNVYSNDIYNNNNYQNIPITMKNGGIEIDQRHSEIGIEDDIIIHDIDDDKPKPQNIINPEIDHSTQEQSNIEYVRVMSEYSKTIQDQPEGDDDEDQPEDGFNKPPDPTTDKPKQPPVIVIKSPDDNLKSKVVNNRQFDGMVNQFTEKEGIKRAIRRMQEMNKNGQLKLPNINPHEFKREFEKPDKENFPILSLMSQSYYFAQEFIKAASDQEIPFSSIAANILVDCSSFISDENKAFNMLIICALTQALNALEIPYSAAVIADENFKCVIKPFSEPHSHYALQRICDCLFIKRYRTKLANSMKFAITSMSYSADTSRPNRAIFTLTDGLDEQLILTKSWADQVLNNEKISFGFVFIKSAQLTGENLQFLENTWSNFEAEVKSHNARSIVKVASINAIFGKAVADKLSAMFATVMKRYAQPDSNASGFKYQKPQFETHEKLSKIPLERLSRYLEFDLENIKCGVYVERTQALKNANTIHDKPDSSFYRSKLGKIAQSKLDASLSKSEYESFLRNFIENRRKLNQAALETIFKPNKASQTVLSTTGTDFDITALILNLINPVPDPLIYLEEKGGLVRNYGVTVIIDPSVSCFHDLSGPHSLQTIRNILSSIASLDLPCFDLIVAGNKEPIILCSEVGTNRATNIKSSLWESLLSVLQTPLKSVDLASAIHTAFELRLMRSTEYSSVLFVLTDGLFEQNDRSRIIDAVNNCVQSGMSTFGVGIGIYPKGIEKLFPQVIYSPNPSNTMKGIASIYGDSLSNQLTEWPSISIPRPDDNQNAIADTNDAMRLIIKNESTPSYQSLKNDLNSIMPALDAFDDLYNQEQDIGNEKEGYKNPVGVNTELYVKDILKSQKILIVMLWDNTMNKNESEFVNPKYIFQSSQPPRTECIKTAVDHYGIELKVVQDYDEAIKELTKQTLQGYCDYYAVWVFCGPPYPVLPNKDADPHLMGDFIQVLIKFWKNGGSIVFMAEGGEKNQLTFQANKFLEEVVFEQEPACPSGKTSLRLTGEHKGEEILHPDDSDKLTKPKTFSRSAQFFKQCQRTKLSHNIGKIFEGITISYAPYDLEMIKPFRPFARDSQGGISTLFYPANLRTGVGDIVIDCGFTKCFTEMTTDGTFRYIQNLAGWTGRPEVHLAIDKGIQPCDWRPKAISHKTQRGKKYGGFLPLPKPPVVPNVDPLSLPRNLWCIDYSGSVSGSSLYHGQLSQILTKYRKSNDEFYFWDHEIHPTNYSGVVSFISRKEGHGGTSSELIADICQRSSIRDHLIIVTDGQVGTCSIDSSDSKMKSNNIKFKYVTTYVIGNGGNLSVGAPYSRGCPNVTYKVLRIGSEIPQSSLTAQDMATLNGISNISSYSEFAVQYKNLESAIQAKTLGTNGDAQLQGALNALSTRINNSGLNSSQKQDFNTKIGTLQIMANGALRNAFTLDDIGAALRKK